MGCSLIAAVYHRFVTYVKPFDTEPGRRNNGPIRLATLVPPTGTTRLRNGRLAGDILCHCARSGGATDCYAQA